MITDQNNLNVVTQISKLFFPNDSVNQSVVYERLKTYLNDQLFSVVLGLLSSGRIYIFNDTRLVPQPTRSGYTPRINIFNHYMDLFFGGSGNGQINDVPVTMLTNRQSVYQKIGLNYLGTLVVNGTKYDIVQNPNVQGYGITYTPNLVPEGGGGETGGGGVYVDPYKTGNNTGGGGTVTQTPTNQTSFLGIDLNNLLIPGALVVLYLMMKK